MTSTNRHIQVLLGIIVLGLLVGGPVAAIVLSGQRAADKANEARMNQIAACERGNALREAIYQNSLSDGRTRKAAAPQYTDEAREAILNEAAKNFASARELVKASADVAAEPGSVEQDCEKAYPPLR